MIRTALRPRWLLWLVLALAACALAVQLGRWQLGVAHADAVERARQEAESKPTAPIGQVLTPGTRWDGRVMNARKVTITGSYEPTGQFLVPDRYLDGRRGYWVVTPLRTADPAGVIAAVRGWTDSPTAPPPPTGEHVVTGTLAQGESPVGIGAEALPAGQEGSIDLARLVNEWHGPLFNAFTFVQAEQPDAAGLTRVPPPLPEGGVNLRNAAYAVQWWVFGAFALFLWWRMVAAAHKDAQAAARPGPTPEHGGGPGPGPQPQPAPVPARPSPDAAGATAAAAQHPSTGA